MMLQKNYLQDLGFIFIPRRAIAKRYPSLAPPREQLNDKDLVKKGSCTREGIWKAFLGMSKGVAKVLETIAFAPVSAWLLAC
jgi:hypothetical protein